MKRLSTVFLVGVTALALFGFIGISPMAGGCSALEGSGSTTWCIK